MQIYKFWCPQPLQLLLGTFTVLFIYRRVAAKNQYNNYPRKTLSYQIFQAYKKGKERINDSRIQYKKSYFGREIHLLHSLFERRLQFGDLRHLVAGPFLSVIIAWVVLVCLNKIKAFMKVLKREILL